MNQRERDLACLCGEPADRVPLILEGFRFCEASELEAITSPLERAVAERAFHHVTGLVHLPTAVNRYLVTPPQRMRVVGRERSPLGSETVTTCIDTPRGPLTAKVGRNPTTRTSWTVKYPCTSLEDIEKIRSIPWEMPPGLGPPDRTRLPDSFADRCLLRAAISSPFVCVAGMMPYEYFLELCMDDMDLLEELTAICLERILAIMDQVLAQGGVDLVWMGGCEWLTPPMASPAHYQKLVQPFEQRIIERAHRAGALVQVHCHGCVASTLPLVIARGADLFEPVEPPPDGDISMAQARAAAADRLTLAGNVEARILAHAPPEEVEEATRAAFAGGRERFMLADTAGPIGALTPQMAANYHRMLDVYEALSI